MALFSLLLLLLYLAFLCRANRFARALMRRCPVPVPKGAGILTYPLA